MNAALEKINLALITTLILFLVLGLSLLAIGVDWLSRIFLLAAAIGFPIVLASKGIQFIRQKQLRKASLSIILLSVVCLLSILFVFV